MPSLAHSNPGKSWIFGHRKMFFSYPREREMQKKKHSLMGKRISSTSDTPAERNGMEVQRHRMARVDEPPQKGKPTFAGVISLGQERRTSWTITHRQLKILTSHLHSKAQGISYLHRHTHTEIPRSSQFPSQS